MFWDYIIVVLIFFRSFFIFFVNRSFYKYVDVLFIIFIWEFIFLFLFINFFYEGVCVFIIILFSIVLFIGY